MGLSAPADEIVNGSDDFVGLLPMINRYLDDISMSLSSRDCIDSYLALVSKRASCAVGTVCLRVSVRVFRCKGWMPCCALTSRAFPFAVA